MIYQSNIEFYLWFVAFDWSSWWIESSNSINCGVVVNVLYAEKFIINTVCCIEAYLHTLIHALHWPLTCLWRRAVHVAKQFKRPQLYNRYIRHQYLYPLKKPMGIHHTERISKTPNFHYSFVFACVCNNGSRLIVHFRLQQ